MKGCKKVLLATGMVILMAASSFAQEEASGINFQILGQGALGYAYNKDMADLAKAIGDYDAAAANTYAAGLGEIGGWGAKDKSIPAAFGADIEPRLFFGNFGLGVSIGYHFAEAKTEVVSSRWTDEATVKMQLFVLPIAGTFYYKTTLSDTSSLVFGAGVGYYTAKLKHKTDGKGVFGNISETFKADGIGYHAKIEYDYIMDGNIVLFGGILGRYAEIDEYEASDGTIVKNTDSSNLSAGLTGVSFYIGAGLSL